MPFIVLLFRHAGEVYEAPEGMLRAETGLSGRDVELSRNSPSDGGC